MSDLREADASRCRALLSLWWAPLDVSSSALRGLSGSLSVAEQERADRFHRPLDRGRFLAARGWLRRLLASQLDCAPGDVGIVTDKGGKPRLADSHLRFNAARSADIALYVTSWTMEVGVDIEAVRATADVEAIATKFFSPAEQRALAAVPSAQRLAACFQCWTHKEAYVKGIGAGLTVPLRTIDVWVGVGERAIASGWAVQQVTVTPGFAASVAGASVDEWVANIPRELSAS